jgi:hypothetical protein
MGHVGVGVLLLLVRWQEDPVLRNRVSVYASKFRALPRMTEALVQIDSDDATVCGPLHDLSCGTSLTC